MGSHVAVLGAGAWGTALAKLLADKGEQVIIWSKDEDVASSIENDHINRRYLPGITLPVNVHSTSDPAKALTGATMVLLVVPSHATRQVHHDIGHLYPRGVPLVSCTKGIENDTLMLMHEVARDVLGPWVDDVYTVLSGPSFAKEVALQHPTAVVVAGKNPDVVREVQERFSSDVFRAYSSDDLIGVEMAGALKNVIAIAAGAIDGLGFGHNSRAGMITRGLTEIARVAMVRGGNPLTVAGLAGMGDLVLTCTGDLSRNRTVGVGLGQGKSLEQILRELGHVAEGVKTAKSAFQLSRALNVEMPITEQVHATLYEGKSARQAVTDIMRRALRPELDKR